MNFGGKVDARVYGRDRPAVPTHHGGLRLRLYVCLLCLDAGAILLAFAVGLLLDFGRIDRSYLELAIAIVPVYAGIAVSNGAYALQVLRNGRIGIPRAFGSLAFTLGSVALLAYYLHVNLDVSRLSAGVGMVGSFALIGAFRLIFNWLVRRAWGGVLTSEVVIFDEVSIQTPPYATVLNAAEEGLRPNTRDPMMLDRLAKRLRGVDRVIVACRPEWERAWAMLLKGGGIQGEVIATEFDAVGAIGLSSLCGRTTLVVATGPLSLTSRMIKRTFDLFFTVPALFVLAPMFLGVALAIKLDSRGPVFFKQKRVGRGNELFDVFKFRSMRVEGCDAQGARSATRDDDRITRVGAFIRKTSIDELPQLLNVLFGSMSLVGPRPHALGSLAGQELFWEVDERYWHRHALKPGITGLAQVRGFRGATHRRDDLTRRLQADLEYLQGWSVWRDFGILLSTARVIVHKNAY